MGIMAVKFVQHPASAAELLQLQQPAAALEAEEAFGTVELTARPPPASPPAMVDRVTLKTDSQDHRLSLVPMQSPRLCDYRLNRALL